MTPLVLIDTSVWIVHFARRDAALSARIPSPRSRVHEFIVGELVLGTIPRGHPAADELIAAPKLPTLEHEEVLRFAELHRLQGSGIGWVDAHLLASALVSSASVWTMDRSMARAAHRVGISLA
jgi:predicted nucleic acid-binding protein